MKILNEQVVSAIKSDYKLAIAFMIIHHGYDEDIDPLHNPDYVASAKQYELETLERARLAVKTAEDYIRGT